MDLKTLKKLVAFARQAGIVTYKSQDIEFTLSPTDPKQEKKLEKKLKQVEQTVEQRLAEMDDETLLLYSSQGINEQDV